MHQSIYPQLSFRLPLDPARLLRARQRIREYLFEHGADAETVNDVVLAIEEAMTNAVRHSGSSEDLEIELGLDGGDLMIGVRDHGRGFDVERFDPDRRPGLLEPGGRGLFLIASLMDDLELRCHSGLELRAVKRRALPDAADGRRREWADDVHAARPHAEPRQQGLLDEIDDGFVAIDWEWTYVYANPVALELLRHPEEELIGAKVWELFPESVGTEFERYYRLAMEQGFPTHFEFYFEPHEVWYELRVYPTSTGISVYFNDITERKRAEEALRESRSKLRSALASMTDAVFITDVEGHFVDFNDAFATFHRFRDRDECATTLAEYTDILDVYLPDGTIASLDAWAVPRALRGEVAANAEYTLHRKDTGDTWIGSYSFGPIRDEEGRIVGAVVIGRDVTEIRRADRELAQRHELLQTLVDSIPVLLVLWDPELQRFTLNRHVTEVLGWTTDDANEGDFMAKVYPDAEYRAEVTAFMQQLEAGWREWDAATKDGRNVPTSWANVRLSDETMIGIGVDLRERKAAEEALRRSERAIRESEQKFSTAFYASPAFMFLTEAGSGRFVEVNEAYCRLTGYAREELLGRTSIELGILDHETRAELVGSIADAGGTRDVETAIHAKTGEKRWCVWSGEIVDVGGTSLVLASGQDVTERRRAEEALRESEERLRFALDAGAFGTFDVNTETGEASWDRRQRELWGVAADEAVDYGAVLSRVHPDDRDGVTSRFEAALSPDGDGSYEATYRILRPDGSVRWLTSRGLVVFQGEGQERRAGRVVGVEQDVTAAREAAEALRESEHRLRLAKEATGLGVHEFDPVSGRIEWDPRVRELWGVGPEEPISYEMFMAGLHPDDREATQAAVDRSLDPKSDGMYEAVYRVTSRRDGRTRWVRAVGRTYFSDGQPVRLVGTVEDVTERKRAADRTQLELSAAMRLSKSIDPNDVAATLMEVLRETTGRRRVVVSLYAAQTDELSIVATSAGPSLPMGSRIPVDALAPQVRRSLEEGHALVVDYSAPDMPERSRERARSVNTLLALSVPLVLAGRVVGHIGLDQPGERREFNEEEIALIELIASRGALALENARLYEEQRRIATTLQENLIHPLPSVDGLELAARSMTANEPELVGGDFRDVFVLADGQVVVLVGDVAGKGIRAAGMTETVRSTVRAFATMDAAPSFILRKTSELLLRHDPGGPHVTAFVAVIDPRTGHVAAASAGHPAPVHLSPFSCSPMEIAFGPPLGVVAADYVPTHLTMTPDDCLVLYTDGVIEARRADEFFGEERLVETVARLRGRSADDVADTVTDTVRAFGGQLRDDLQVLVLRLACLA